MPTIEIQGLNITWNNDNEVNATIRVLEQLNKMSMEIETQKIAGRMMSYHPKVQRKV